jgi:hypothetical protein
VDSVPDPLLSENMVVPGIEPGPLDLWGLNNLYSSSMANGSVATTRKVAGSRPDDVKEFFQFT